MLHMVHCTLHRGGLVAAGLVSGFEALACYIAAVVHDVEHPGERPALWAGQRLRSGPSI